MVRLLSKSFDSDWDTCILRKVSRGEQTLHAKMAYLCAVLGDDRLAKDKALQAIATAPVAKGGKMQRC